MPFEFSFFNFFTLIIAVLTIWLIRSRMGGAHESNWPLLYYFILVMYIRGFEGQFDNRVIFAGIVAALFLRFEFLGGFFLKFFKFVEFVVHAYMLFRAFQILFTM
ncbi:MAG: hypothetical protein ACRD8O_22955 [Bryobacteraceae bacterium]